MSRTKAEVRAFLDSKVGTVVPHPGYPDLRGQCVTLTKALMEFLGVPNPYAARGNAIDAGDTYIRQGLGKAGKGWLTIVVNRDMGFIDGVHYGHIWIDLAGEANYESNGNRALYTTKNTRPLSQGQQFINFDQWIVEDNVMNRDDAVEVYRSGLHREPENDAVADRLIGKRFGDVSRELRSSPEWLAQNHAIAFFGKLAEQLNQANVALDNANKQLKAALDNDVTDKKAIADAQKKTQEATENLAKVTEEYNKTKQRLDEAQQGQQEAEKTGNAFLRWLGEQLNKIMGGK